MTLNETGRRKRAGGREEMKHPEVNGKEWKRIKQKKTELKHIPNKTDKASSNSKQD